MYLEFLICFKNVKLHQIDFEARSFLLFSIWQVNKLIFSDSDMFIADKLNNTQHHHHYY